jgi:SET family sugar efflux transporter-like MFS transporter
LTASPLRPYAGDVNAPLGRRSLFAPAFIGLLATMFVLGLTSAFVAPFGSLWATQEIGMSPRMLGAFMAITALSAILVTTLVARWSDSHVSRRTLLAIGCCGGALNYVGYALVRDPLLLLVLGSTLLAVASMNFAQFFAHVREELGRAEGADVTFLLGVLRACYALAWALGPNLGAAIKARFGYPGLFWSVAFFFVALLGFVLAFVAHRPRVTRAVSAGDVPSKVAFFSGARRTRGLASPVALAHAAAFGLMFAALTLNGLNLPLFLTQQLGGTERTVGLAFAISPVFEMLFMVLFGHIAAKGRQRQVQIILCGAAASVCYFLALRFVSEPWQVYPLQILNATAVAVVTSVAIPFFQDLLPQQTGVSTSLYSNALKVGSLVGFSLFGALASAVGNSGLFLVCAALSATTFSIIFVARPRSPSGEAPNATTATKAPV